MTRIKEMTFIILTVTKVWRLTTKKKTNLLLKKYVTHLEKFRVSPSLGQNCERNIRYVTQNTHLIPIRCFSDDWITHLIMYGRLSVTYKPFTLFPDKIMLKSETLHIPIFIIPGKTLIINWSKTIFY